MRAESVSVAGCLLWKWEVFQSQVPAVPKLFIDPLGSWLGLEGRQLSFWGLFPASRLDLALLLLFPQPCLHVCLCSVLPDPRAALLPLSVSTLCQMCLLVCVSIGDKAGPHAWCSGSVPVGWWHRASVLPPPFPGCMMERGVFFSGTHNHSPTFGSEGDGAGGHGADMRTEGCTFTPGLLSQHRALRCDGEQWLRQFLCAGFWPPWSRVCLAAWRSQLFCQGPFGAGTSFPRLVRAAHPPWCLVKTERAACAPLEIQAISERQTLPSE